LAHMPFRFIGLPKEMIAQRGIPQEHLPEMFKEAFDLLPGKICRGITQIVKWINIKNGLPHGLIFATRPFNLAELFVLAEHPFSHASLKSLRQAVLALRGFDLSENMPKIDENNVLQIPNSETRTTRKVAVSSWKNDYENWLASVSCSKLTDLNRYLRLTRLINSVLAQPKGANYFILPELALPAHWFMRVALKLQARGISFITGIEYLHASKGRVRNQVWAALSHNGSGFPSTMIYQQDKQRPALHEEKELWRLAELELEPKVRWKTPPIIQHGSFRYSLLVCSELTNLSYRAALRGQIDALFILEWNQDTETFNALIESSALDIHAYIIQCNDRQYGDSRIRAPYKEAWLRDVLRVKGGIDDFCVIGELDVECLRRFQSSHRSPAQPFKPVPDGFVIAQERRALPVG
jgi:hypothetical protein